MNIYVVYLTTYFGSKLPMYYIGSTSLNRFNSGYRGSVISKEYKDIWKSELQNNPHLFKTKILIRCQTREEAFDKELKLQLHVKAPHNNLYANRAYAIANGYFGIGRKGAKRSDAEKSKISKTLRNKWKLGELTKSFTDDYIRKLQDDTLYEFYNVITGEIIINRQSSISFISKSSKANLIRGRSKKLKSGWTIRRTIEYPIIG